MPLTESKATTDGKRPRIPKGRIVLLIGLALVLVLGGAGFLYTSIAKQRTINAHATATVQAKLAGTHAAATATYQAIATFIAASQARATATAIQVTATATALQNIYIQATRGSPALNDPLVDNSKGYGWDTSSFTGGAPCEFTGGAYHVKSQLRAFSSLCIAQGTDYSNFAFQIQMTIIAGDSGGIVFRADAANARYYLFQILSDGSYDLSLYPGSTGSRIQSLVDGSSSAINTGLNQPNLITVIARGSSIDLFVNHVYLTGGRDSTFSHGQIGVMAYDAYGNSTEVAYSNAKVWTL